MSPFNLLILASLQTPVSPPAQPSMVRPLVSAPRANQHRTARPPVELCVQHANGQILSGRLVEEVGKPGPDLSEKYLALHLDNPTCMLVSSSNAAHKHVDIVQLFVLPADLKQDRELLGQHVRVIGKAWDKLPGHPYTEIILTVSSMLKAP